MDVRRLEEVDRKKVEAFLCSRPTQTMFLGSNLAMSGFRGEDRYGGIFLGAFQGDTIQGMVQLVNMGSLLLSANTRDALVALVPAVLELPSQPARFIGMANEISDFLDRYQAERPLKIRHTRECLLQSLVSENLQPRAMLGFRAATFEDVDLLLPWIQCFRQEELAEGPEDFDEVSIRGALEEKISRGWRYLLLEAGEPVSTLTISAEAFGLLQVGGIFTPKEQRGKGYATRLLSSFANFHLNALGAKRIVLQVGNDNLPALRAYEKVGFRSSGNYRFVFCED